jgi:hypothetical protein
MATDQSFSLNFNSGASTSGLLSPPQGGFFFGQHLCPLLAGSQAGKADAEIAGCRFRFRADIATRHAAVWIASNGM